MGRGRWYAEGPSSSAKNAGSREAILGKLEETLSSQEPKAVIGNKGFRSVPEGCSRQRHGRRQGRPR